MSQETVIAKFESLKPLTSTPASWPEPQPLPDGMPAVMEFNPELLPTEFCPWIEDIANRMQCPVDYLAASSMVALSGLVGRQVGIRPKRHDDWIVVPNLWGAAVGPPGVQKTPAVGETMKPLQALEVAARDAFNVNSREYEADRLIASEQLKAARDAIRKALSKDNGQDVKALARDALDDPAAPQRRRYMTSDATVEKIGELLSANPRGILVHRDELTGFFRNLDKAGSEGARAFYLESWNGTGRYTFDRIGRGTVDIESCCVSLFGTIQPGPLSDYIAGALRGGAGDDGLIQRLQMLVWPDPPRTWRNVDKYPDSHAKAQARAVFERLDQIDPATIGATCDDGIPWLQFSDQAQDLFDEWRHGLEGRLRDDDLPPAFQSHLAKYRSLIPSLALLCHLADVPEGGRVSAEAIARAADFGEYLESHARRLYSPALDPALNAARELDRRIRRGDVSADFAARDIYRRGWRLLDTDGTRKALDVLADYNRVLRIEVPTIGRTAEVWRINPQLRSKS